MSIVLKRIYEEKEKTSGYRVLIDRVWPRGISKEKAQLDDWAKVLSPSSELRKWFNHDPDKFQEFEEKYKKELNNSNTAKDKKMELKEIAQENLVILFYGAKDKQHNHATLLKEWLVNGK
ncbi:Uncharacterized conserved protein YeaO, DUF488 family [Halobacillus karajensis]|uniref:DUF488 domain-containing protein n=1 Tax=Halobacillus karajensis TaxID=195088 RepID=A0A059NXA8_9BACI|nr:DUF488 family protein [Halobacillus karajensis]CDQ18565.1 hypothetical protein BN982_00839 [Halobacillus karajensis]CDQ23363.1 hypothetical protein BN983_01589 [Halobacillus karajensis]CDQ26845.1 hypothetical protein BN981_01069 [Halobacillus karajensis]SEH49833.1 Uncharacterized conserved protein YeaO, DUF488 family [Halobacillus karajensis]